MAKENSDSLSALLPEVVTLSETAGRRILEIYQGDYEVRTKADGSPVTTADHRSHDLIVQGLSALTPDLPVITEEGEPVDFAQRTQWPQFWLVDPLDGTKEFVNRNGEFTVNIALIEDGESVLGVIHTPAKDLSHWAARDHGAFRRQGQGEVQAIQVRNYQGGVATVVASRSHGRETLAQFLDNLSQREGEFESLSMGSALKLCLVAEGRGDVYPRLGPTYEWDTAAAQCIVETAGGRVTDRYNRPLRYNKTSLLNPWFLVQGGGGYDWCGLLEGVVEPGA